MPEKPSKDAGRWSVRATNHSTGEVWAIDDTKDVCDSELEAKLSEWGGKAVYTVDGPLQAA